MQRGLEYEEIRQAEILSSGGEVVQETRRWDEAQGKTLTMRGKEEAHDYRYFPDPDLVRLYIDDEWKARVRATIPELPDARKARYTEQLGLPAYDAEVITSSKKLADLFEESLSHTSDSKAVSNWIMISSCREKPLARRRCPYRKPTQVGGKRILRRAEELSLRNSAK